MTLKKRLEKLEAQHQAAGLNEPLVVRWADGQEIATLDPCELEEVWPCLFESIAREGRTINDQRRKAKKNGLTYNRFWP